MSWLSDLFARWRQHRPPAPRPEPAPDPLPADVRSQLLLAHNAARIRAGLKLLAMSPQLSQSAQAWARQSSGQARFQGHALHRPGVSAMSSLHPGQLAPFGLGISHGDWTGRIAATGYHWAEIAENIAAGQKTISEVVEAWMSDGPHQQNILGPFMDVGFGIVTGVDGTIYWAADFGMPQGEQA